MFVPEFMRESIVHSLYSALLASFWRQNLWLGGLRKWGSIQTPNSGVSETSSPH